MKKEKSVDQDKKIQQLMEIKREEIKALKKLLIAFDKDENRKNPKV